VFTYPEIASQQRDVEEGGAREAIQNRNHGVKESQNKRVASQVPADGPIPSSIVKAAAIKYGALDTAKIPFLG
jgi:hypothetical protein